MTRSAEQKSTPADDEEGAAWERYSRDQNSQDREWLIALHLPFATMLAAKAFGDRQVRELEFADFRQFAIVGLLEAIDRYDHRQGTEFRSFAAMRIRGSILNGVERSCEKQQQITSRARMRQERFKDMLTDSGAEQGGAFSRLVDFTIGAAIGYMLEGTAQFQSGAEVCDCQVYRSQEVRDLSRMLERALQSLPEQEQVVLRGHYQQQLRFDELASKMGLTKGRVSQIHHRGLRRIRDLYDELRVNRSDF